MRSPDLDPWAEALDTFPLTGEPAARLAALVRFAVLAPSSHNSQPWLFRVEGDVLELWADRTRALAVSDPEDRELTISCGCALLNLRIALRSFGQKIACQLLPDPAQPDLMARVRLEGDQEPGQGDRDLFRAISQRRDEPPALRTPRGTGEPPGPGPKGGGTRGGMAPDAGR